MAENKIAEWLHNKGDEGLKKRGKLTTDRHKYLSRSLGVHDDYIHSKILADNNVRPDSLQRRIELDCSWDKLKLQIREEYTKSRMTMDEFVKAQSTIEQFGEKIDTLDRMAKSLNHAIVSDSMRFNGRCPVRHARRFTFDERIKEAAQSC